MPVSAAAPTIPALQLPPAFSLVSLRESADAFAHACRIAREAGAGTFVWVRRFDVLEFAVVLEPEEPLVGARRAVFAGMAALADALASLGPPEKPVSFTWPTTVHFDAGRLGGGRLGWPEDCAEHEVPEWLVFSGMLLSAIKGGLNPGERPEVTWLEEEGFDTAHRHAILESFARHLLVAFDTWTERGFKPVADAYLARLPRDDGDGRRGIDGNGDLLIHRPGGLDRIALLPALRAQAWYDPATGLPRL
jgi:Biotin/lipoate A/B protein ligase family